MTTTFTNIVRRTLLSTVEYQNAPFLFSMFFLLFVTGLFNIGVSLVYWKKKYLSSNLFISLIVQSSLLLFFALLLRFIPLPTDYILYDFGLPISWTLGMVVTVVTFILVVGVLISLLTTNMVYFFRKDSQLQKKSQSESKSESKSESIVFYVFFGINMVLLLIAFVVYVFIGGDEMGSVNGIYNTFFSLRTFKQQNPNRSTQKLKGYEDKLLENLFCNLIPIRTVRNSKGKKYDVFEKGVFEKLQKAWKHYYGTDLTEARYNKMFGSKKCPLHSEAGFDNPYPKLS
jgi:hypothetical protein